MKDKFAAVFPGQGSQHVGMLSELANQFRSVRETFAEASAVLGEDLWLIAQEGPADLLSQTANTQPIILTASIAIWRLWQERGGVSPAMMAGHSLGEYSALVAAESLSLTSAVKLVRQRGIFMQNAVPAGTGAMAAIVGLDDETVIRVCSEISSSDNLVSAVNFNSPGQIVIAGHTGAVELAGEACKAAGAKRALPLPVSAPFHSPLMKPAAEQFAEVIAEVKITPPKIPVLQNYSLQASDSPAVIRNNLIQQVYHPVPWVKTIELIAKSGVLEILELGPGKVLAGLNKRIINMSTTSINDTSSLASALES